MADPAPFRRAILTVGAEGADRRVVRAAAEFARLLKLEMLGVFIEDQSLLDLASFPFARELRLPGHDWQPLDARQVGHELQALAQRARKLFHQEAKSLGMSSRFEVRRCEPRMLPAGIAQLTDILIVAEPASVDLLTPTVARFRLAALASAASILLLPSTGIPTIGPVAVVAPSRADRAVVVASRFAAAVDEQAILVPAADETSAKALTASLQDALGAARERLLVLARRDPKRFDQIALQLAADRGVPLLLVDSGFVQQAQAEPAR
jgi:hypothetical protein